MQKNNHQCKLKLNSILILLIFQACAVIYMDLSKSHPLDAIEEDLKTGLILRIPKNKKAFITNMVSIEILQDSARVLASEIPWYSNTSFKLNEGEYIVNTHVHYMNHSIWKTSDSIFLLKNEIKNIQIKYPFLATGKPKVTII